MYSGNQVNASIGDFAVFAMGLALIAVVVVGVFGLIIL
jgi:hypothetical protein